MYLYIFVGNLHIAQVALEFLDIGEELSHTYVSIRQHTSAYVSIRQHTSAYVSIRQHTSAYDSIPAYRQSGARVSRPW
jgi:hypothetical protein